MRTNTGANTGANTTLTWPVSSGEIQNPQGEDEDGENLRLQLQRSIPQLCLRFPDDLWLSSCDHGSRDLVGSRGLLQTGERSGVLSYDVLL